MTTKTPNDPFAAIRAAGTSAPNFDLDTDAIIAKLTQWQSLCDFNVTGATGDTVDLEFVTLPEDICLFICDLYEFCPDLVEQGTGCVHLLIEAMEEAGKEITPELKKFVEGVDLTDENYGLDILLREIEQRKSVKLWWD